MGKYKLSGVVSSYDTSVEVQLQMYSFMEGNSYIVYCPALDISSYGDTEDAAQKAFEDILAEHVNYWLNKKTLFEDLKKHGWDIRGRKQRKIKAPTFDKMLKMNEALRDITRNKDYRKYSQQVGLPEVC